MQKTELIKKLEVENYSPQTIKSYKSYVDKYVIFCKGNLENQENILDYLLMLKNKNYSISSIRVAKYSIKFFYEQILKQTLDTELPKIRREKRLPKPVSRYDILRMIKVTKNLKHRIIIELMYGCGLRLSEAQKLQWNDIDFRENILRIQLGKGFKDRMIMLPKIVAAHLWDYHNSRDNKDCSYVCDSEAKSYQDKYLSKKAIYKVIKNAAKKAGIKKNITPHMLRHSFATHLVEQGENLRVIQELLGHNSPQTTMIYTKVATNTIRKVVSPLDKLKIIKCTGAFNQ